MKVSLKWLKRYVDIDVSPEVLCDKMTMSGFEVEEMIDLSATMDNVVVGKVLQMEHHPDADKLWVCQLDVGGEDPVQIITGAQNVFEGALVPAALHDSHLPNGVHIKKGKLRGLPSNGMMCSGEELCLKEEDYPGAEVHGILILQEDYAPGTDMREVIGLNDVIIDFSILSNRPDCNSVIGIAREVAVVLGKEFHSPSVEYTTKGGDVHDHIAIRVDDFDLCPRYIGRVVRNLRIGPSPAWMRECLKSAGVRSINNIVDITNFVLLETGQPMHAYDLRYVTGNQIIVRHAHEGELMKTLDDKEHTLTSDMLVIADAENPSCLAGIMGSLHSEIEPDTTELLFETAKFRRDNIRRTARALGMRTESSARFEKGTDICGCEFAMNRALQLVQELDCGDIVDGVIDVNNGLPEPRVINTTIPEILALLGVEIPDETVVSILNSLNLTCTLGENGALSVSIPSYRDDIESRADLSEEVMRIYGYEHIVSTPISGEIIRGKKLPERIAADTVKELLTGQSMREIMTYSFISAKACDMLSLPADDWRRNGVALLNPLGEEYAVMRTQLVSSMATVLATNVSRKNPAGRFFEVSKLFIPKALPLTEQPDEVPALSIGMYGNGEDFFTLKGIVEMLMARCKLTVSYRRSSEPYLHPGRQAEVVCGSTVIGVLGELHPLTAEKYGIDTRAYVAEIRLEKLYTALINQRTFYKPLPRHPASVRDLSVLADAKMAVADIEAAIRKGAGKVLENVKLFDVYQGKQVPDGQKSVSYSLTLRAADRTLTVEECDNVMQKVLKALEEIGISMRS